MDKVMGLGLIIIVISSIICTGYILSEVNSGIIQTVVEQLVK